MEGTFGWLQAPATMDATAEMQWRSPAYSRSSLKAVLKVQQARFSVPISRDRDLQDLHEQPEPVGLFRPTVRRACHLRGLAPGGRR